MFATGYYLLRKDIIRIELKNGCLTIDRTAGKPNTYYWLFNSDDFRAKHGLTLGGRSIERPYSIDLTMQVPFEVCRKSRLVVAVPNEGGNGMPVEAFQRMIVLPPAKAKAIQLFVIKDLQGRVKIKTAEGALGFCRLLTSPVTCYYLDSPGVEVASKDQLDLTYFFGDKERLSYYRSAKCDGYMGVVESKADLKNLGIQPARVRRVSKGYEVRRTLLVEEKLFECKFVDVLETVGTDGRYSRVTVKEHSIPASNKYTIGINHPM
jgi:hypothetical protein